MKSIHPQHTEQNTIDPVNDPALDPASYWRTYNVCKLGQEIPPEIVQIMADSASQALTDWLREIDAPTEVRGLYNNVLMLTIYDRQIAAGIALSPLAGADLLDIMVSAGKNMRAVGAQFCPCGTPKALPGTLPRYKLQAIDLDTVIA